MILTINSSCLEDKRHLGRDTMVSGRYVVARGGQLFLSLIIHVIIDIREVFLYRCFFLNFDLFLPTHCRCRGLLLPLITLNRTHSL